MSISSMPLFQNYRSKEDYERAGVIGICPMTAKEIEQEEEQDKLLASSNYYVEEKFDGTRATLHFYEHNTRCFSRRISVKTNWYCENSDSLPHIRDLNIPELNGTIIDGEMFIPNRPFKDVSSTLNCTWDEAVRRQKELGNIVFHAFDIMYYKGLCIEHLPLEIRKQYLIKVVKEINSPYIKLVKFYDKEVPVNLSGEDTNLIMNSGSKYPTLYAEYYDSIFPQSGRTTLSHKAYYEYIVMNGGEGVILKPKDGKYYHKRGREYQKIKKFLTRDVIIMGFSAPEDQYKGKFPSPDKWDYWESYENDIIDLSQFNEADRKMYIKNSWNKDEWRPVSKFYANNWVGNIRYGVIITDEEMSKLPKNKKFNIEELINKETGEVFNIIEVGECSGFDEEMREYFSDNSFSLVSTVIEVKANELFKDTGKMRHPRFMRMRPDKNYEQCIWKDHINN